MSSTQTATATLIHGSKSTVVTREDLRLLVTPEPTKSWKPVPHIELVERVATALNDRGITIRSEEFAIQRSGHMMFGVMRLTYGESDSHTAAIALRQSLDKSMAIQIGVGMNVLVCDNLAFSGNMISMKRKHTHAVELQREIHGAIDTFERQFLQLEESANILQMREIDDAGAKVWIYDAIVKHHVCPLSYLPDVHKEYFEPRHQEFEARNLWSLHNSFTEALKPMSPVSFLSANRKLANLFDLDKDRVIDTTGLSMTTDAAFEEVTQ